MKNIYKYIFRSCIGLAMLIAGEGVMWGGSSYYYAKLTVKSGGNGSVYIDQSGTMTKEIKTDNGGDKASFTVNATPNTGYHFASWTVEKGKGSVNSTTQTNITVTSAKSDAYDTKNTSGDDDYYYNNYTATANFAENYYAKLTLSSTGASVTPTFSGTDNVESTGTKVVFNINAPSATGYHFYNWTGDSGVGFGSTTSASTTASVSPATTGGSANAKNYNVVANYKQNQYYATVKLSIYSEKATGGGSTVSGNTAKINEGSPYTTYSTEAGGNVTCNLSFQTAANGWHFAQWNKKSTSGTCSFGSATAKNTTFTFQTSSSYDDDNAEPYTNINSYEIECKFVENYYTSVSTAVKCGDKAIGGKAYVTYGTSISGDVTTTSANDGYGFVSKGALATYSVRAVADDGYHFVNWTLSSKSGSEIVSPSNSTSQLKIWTNADYQGADNKFSFVITANFEKDKFNAKLNVANSSASDTSSSIAQVSADSTNWSSSATIAAETKSTNVPFYLKATPVAGLKFVGWSETDSSTTTIPGIGANGKYNVVSAATQGATNEKSIYAIFKKEYSIVINANGTTSENNRILFKLSGPKEYRVWAKVGSSVTIKDVPAGTYTVTPEKAWSWTYTTTPESQQTTTWDSVNKCTLNFTVSPKPTTRKMVEDKGTKTFNY